MIGLALLHTLEGHIADSELSDVGRKGPDHGRQDKSAASGAAHVFGWTGDFRHPANPTCWRFRLKHERFQCSERHPPDWRKHSGHDDARR
jgi:hypothetical protein